MKLFDNDRMPIDNFLANFSIIGLAIGSVIGLSASSLSKAFVQDIIMPLFGPILGFDRWQNYRLKIGIFNFGVGNFLAELIYFFIIAGIIYVVFAYLLRDILVKVIKQKKQDDIELSKTQKQIVNKLGNIENTISEEYS